MEPLLKLCISINYKEESGKTAVKNFQKSSGFPEAYNLDSNFLWDMRSNRNFSEIKFDSNHFQMEFISKYSIRCFLKLSQNFKAKEQIKNLFCLATNTIIILRNSFILP